MVEIADFVALLYPEYAIAGVADVFVVGLDDQLPVEAAQASEAFDAYLGVAIFKGFDLVVFWRNDFDAPPVDDAPASVYLHYCLTPV